jgi:hypothetical protein
MAVDEDQVSVAKKCVKITAKPQTNEGIGDSEAGGSVAYRARGTEGWQEIDSPVDKSHHERIEHGLPLMTQELQVSSKNTA